MFALDVQKLYTRGIKSYRNGGKILVLMAGVCQQRRIDKKKAESKESRQSVKSCTLHGVPLKGFWKGVPDGKAWGFGKHPVECWPTPYRVLPISPWRFCGQGREKVCAKTAKSRKIEQHWRGKAESFLVSSAAKGGGGPLSVFE